MNLSFDDQAVLEAMTRGFVADYFINVMGRPDINPDTAVNVRNYNMYVTDTLHKAMLVAKKGSGVMDGSFSDLQCVICPKIAAVAKMLDNKNQPMNIV